MAKCKALNEMAAFGYDIGEECGDDVVTVIHAVPVCFTHREKYYRIANELGLSVEENKLYSTDVTAAE